MPRGLRMPGARACRAYFLVTVPGLRRCGLWADADWIQLDRRGAELLFQVLTGRKEKSAVAIASKEPFPGWTKTVTEPSLCVAVVDRLTFNGQIIETGHSCRLAHARRAKASN